MPALGESIAVFELRIPFEHGDADDLEVEAREALGVYLTRRFNPLVVVHVQKMLTFVDPRRS